MATKKSQTKAAPDGDDPPDDAPDQQADNELAGVDFEAALAELEALVEDMEAGELSLEASLAAFERGVRLTRHCQSALKNAELKVKVLTQDDSLEDLDIDALDDA